MLYHNMPTGVFLHLFCSMYSLLRVVTLVSFCQSTVSFITPRPLNKRKVCQPLHFKVPEDSIPVIDTLDEKPQNWTAGDYDPLENRDIFRMPWVAKVAPPRRGWLERAAIASSSEADEDLKQEAQAVAEELKEIEELERDLGFGEEAPVIFEARLGAEAYINTSLGNVSWLGLPGEDILKIPADEERTLKYREPSLFTRINAAIRRRLQPFPLFRRVPKGCVLVASVKGDDLNLLANEGPPSLAKIFEEPPIGWLEPISPLIKAAHDPRVKAVILRIGPLSCGYAKLVEFRRHMDYFKESGKPLIAYLDGASEKEYFAALGCDEIYMPPGGALRLNGFVSAANFLRGVFDNIGLDPVVVRLGDYKSAGDTINRRNSTEAFRLVQETLVNQTAAFWVTQVARDLNKTEEEVQALWETGISDPMRLAYRKFITASLYIDQVKEIASNRFRAKPFPWNSKGLPARLFPVRSFLKAVGRGRRILPGLPFVKGPAIAVINAVGEIGVNGAINARELNSLLDQVEENPRIKAVVLRVDSPGGDALTSELIWRRILRLRSKKPVVASMVDVSASGGYFLSMGCNAIVAEETSITGSIGVVAVVFKLKKLFEKIGLNEESFAIGRYAKFFLPGHSLSDEERSYFEEDVKLSYQDFVQKAAFCRKMTWEQAHAVAQGRVWKGSDAKELGLVDEMGGIWRAIEIAKRFAKIPDKKSVNVVTVRGQKRLFGSKAVEDEDVSVVDLPSSLLTGASTRMGRPLALADDVVGDYMNAMGASVTGVKPWIQGLGLGLLGSLALQDSLAPWIEHVVGEYVGKEIGSRVLNRRR